MRNYLIVINCRLRKKRKTVPKLPFLTIKPPFLGPFFQKKNAKLSHASAQNSCVSRLFGTDRCSFVRGKLPYFLPCAAHMKIRESSTLKFITENFSAKHHYNFSAQRSDFHSARSGKTIPLALPILARRAIIFSAQRGPTESSARSPIVHYELCIQNLSHNKHFGSAAT